METNAAKQTPDTDDTKTCELALNRGQTPKCRGTTREYATSEGTKQKGIVGRESVAACPPSEGSGVGNAVMVEHARGEGDSVECFPSIKWQ